MSTPDVSSAVVPRAPCCVQCGYDLRGLPERGTCPECAGAYEPGAYEQHRFDARWRLVNAIVGVLVGNGLSALSFAMLFSPSELGIVFGAYASGGGVACCLAVRKPPGTVVAMAGLVASGGIAAFEIYVALLEAL